MFQNYRAPKQHGDAVVQPPLANAAVQLESNRGLINQHGSWWEQLRLGARNHMIASAMDYTSAYRETQWSLDLQSAPIVMAGHQPTIFHPGVWFKNFALDHIARDINGLAINLIVDNDVSSGSSLRIPSLNPATGLAQYQMVDFDLPGGGVPFEQRTIQSRQIFDRFDQQVAKTVKGLVNDPCAGRLWAHALAAIDRCGVAGCALAQARHGLEAEIGLQTLEVPLSVICKSAQFAQFAIAIFKRIAEFQTAYNQSAANYRQAHRIRSSAHPVPDLNADDNWYESPFWVYSDGAPQRRALWIRSEESQIQLSDRHGFSQAIPLTHNTDVDFATLLDGKVKIRPRALITTMFARLVLSDLFLHGIGGAKYDQLGDMICRKFFGIAPPSFMVLSATVQLPRTGNAPDADQMRRQLQRKLRDTIFQPEKFFTDPSSSNAALVQQKSELIKNPPAKGNRKHWHDQLTAINAKLSSQLAGARDELNQSMADVQAKLASEQVLSSREHPFCVYPIDYLTETFSRILKKR